MTFEELTRVYIADGGLGVATVLACGFEFRSLKTVDDLAQELIWAEKDILDVGPRQQPPEWHIERHLRRVLKRRHK